MTERLSAHTGGQKDRDRNVAFTEAAKPADRTALLVDECSMSMKHFHNHTGKGHWMSSEEALYQCYSFNHKSHITWPEKENGPP
jgi:hypothetical protein